VARSPRHRVAAATAAGAEAVDTFITHRLGRLHQQVLQPRKPERLGSPPTVPQWYAATVRHVLLRRA
jgi:hypothetical protein